MGARFPGILFFCCVLSDDYLGAMTVVLWWWPGGSWWLMGQWVGSSRDLLLGIWFGPGGL